MFGVYISSTGKNGSKKYILKGDVLKIIEDVGLDRNTYFDEKPSECKKTSRILAVKQDIPVGELLCV